MNKAKSKKFFHYKDLIIKVHQEVYEPAEDTFQILESIKINNNECVLEIGTGCGIIALDCCRQGANVVCSDVNPYAVKLAKTNYELNKKYMNGSFNVRQGDLFSVLSDKEFFNTIIFNPPYLPTSSKHLVGDSGWFDIATSGGKDGLKTTRRFIEKVRNHLKEDGCAYFIFSSLSNRRKLERIILNSDLNYNVVNSYRYNDESLDVYQLFL